MEIWVPYGDVESLVTLMQENLGETVDPKPESHLDEIAHGLGIDPLEIRLLNVLKEGSLSPTSQALHSVVVRESLLQAAQRFGWNGAKA